MRLQSLVIPSNIYFFILSFREEDYVKSYGGFLWSFQKEWVNDQKKNIEKENWRGCGKRQLSKQNAVDHSKLIKNTCDILRVREWVGEWMFFSGTSSPSYPG